MLELGRPSHRRVGFYEYDESGLARGSGPGSPRRSRPPREQLPFEDVKDRLLFVEALETAKCFEEGGHRVRRRRIIGSIMGIGFPALTGGAAQFMSGYENGQFRGGRPDRRAPSSPAPTSGREVRRPVPRVTPWLRDLAASGGSPACSGRWSSRT